MKPYLVPFSERESGKFALPVAGTAERPQSGSIEATVTWQPNSSIEELVIWGENTGVNPRSLQWLREKVKHGELCDNHLTQAALSQALGLVVDYTGKVHDVNRSYLFPLGGLKITVEPLDEMLARAEKWREAAPVLSFLKDLQKDPKFALSQLPKVDYLQDNPFKQIAKEYYGNNDISRTGHFLGRLARWESYQGAIPKKSPAESQANQSKIVYCQFSYADEVIANDKDWQLFDNYFKKMLKVFKVSSDLARFTHDFKDKQNGRLIGQAGSQFEFFLFKGFSNTDYIKRFIDASKGVSFESLNLKGIATVNWKPCSA